MVESSDRSAFLMGISVARDDNRKRFTAVATSPLTVAEILRFMSTHRVGQYRGYSMLFDVEKHFTLSSAEIHTLSEHVGSLSRREGERGRTAIVASDDQAFELVSQYASASNRAGVQIRAFRERDTAKRWLDSDEDENREQKEPW
jgi:hypothetical protein